MFESGTMTSWLATSTCVASTDAVGACVLAWGRVGNHGDSKSIIIWVVVIAAISAVLGVVLLTVRKRTVGSKAEKGADSGLMEELRELRRSGRISEEEFEKARAAWREKAVATMGRKDDKAGQSRGDRAAKEAERARARAAGGKTEGSAGRSNERPADVRVARPGFDLTGAPLPKPTDEPGS